MNDNTVKEKWFRKGDMKGPYVISKNKWLIAILIHPLLFRRFSSTSLMSRAYIAFKSPEELATFSLNYDGHLFRDKQGNQCDAFFSGYIMTGHLRQ